MAGRPRTPSKLDEVGVARTLKEQDGVISRAQVLAFGGRQSDIRRRLRRKEWAQMFPGVYLHHTGEPTWEQRCWGAVLALWPAWLHRDSALRAHGVRRDREHRGAGDPIHVLVDATRTPTPPPGIEVERIRDPRRWVQDNRHPPRAQLEFALLKVAADRDEVGAVAILADACQQGRTTPARLLATLRLLPRLPRRALLLEVVEDVAVGTRSVLERRFLLDVERAHGLPEAERQTRAVSGGRVAYRDVHYRAHGVAVELDGLVGHTDAEDRWADLDRDLAAAEDDVVTLRAGWRQVLSPCRLAMVLARILAARGWQGAAAACGPACPLGDRVGPVSARDPDPTRSERA